MRPVRLIVGLGMALAALLLAAPSSGRQSRHPPDELDISNIKATFTGCPGGGPFPPKPPQCATEYDVRVLNAPKGAKLHYEWYLELKLIDGEGQPEPGNPGSGADFDPSCNNAELPHSKIVEGAAAASGVVYQWQDLKDFVWYHGDVGVYQDRPPYGCDHTKMGPDGHQGVVTLIVDDANPGATYTPWVCQANYYGTDTGLAPNEDTDCHPESEEPGERFLVAIAWNDETTARHMIRSKKNQAGVKSEIEHSLADLKRALAKEKSFPLSDPYWVNNIGRAIKDDEQALKEAPNPEDEFGPLEKAILAKGALLDDADDDDGWAPPPKLLPFFRGR
jgi:hypothetical protein